MQQPTILYEDDSFIAINKPSGMTVNKADTTKSEITVQDWILASHPELASGSSRKEKMLNQVFDREAQTESVQHDNEKDTYNIEEEFYNRGGIVHRLDKETSGILLIAKTPQAFGALKSQFMNRQVQKTYSALAHGKIIPPVGTISVPMGRLAFNRKRFGVVAGGRESITEYNVVSTFQLLVSKNHYEVLSLVSLQPHTGRTHQIRVHLKHINHPIFADELYGGRKTARDDRKLLPRLFLHAAKLRFAHPTTGEIMTLESQLPEELQGFLKNLTITKDS
jgi:RluA family pseudouridine synthase